MYRYSLILVLLFLSPVLSPAQQTETGLPDSTYTHPPASCTVCAGSLWVFENNAQQFDSQYSETELMPYLFCFQSLCYRSRYIAANDFDMSIPSDATITGIEVSLSGFASHPFAVYDSTLRLTKAYNMVGVNVPDSASWQVQDENRLYGTGLGLWGESWTPAEINDPGFGIMFKVFNASDSSPVYKLDVVSITVHYTTPQGSGSQTSTPKNFTTVFEPASGAIHVNFEPETPSSYTFSILTLSGTEVYREVIPEVTSFDARVSALHFNPGIYFVRFHSDKDQFVRKLVIAP